MGRSRSRRPVRGSEDSPRARPGRPKVSSSHGPRNALTHKGEKGQGVRGARARCARAAKPSASGVGDSRVSWSQRIFRTCGMVFHAGARADPREPAAGSGAVQHGRLPAVADRGTRRKTQMKSGDPRGARRSVRIRSPRIPHVRNSATILDVQNPAPILHVQNPFAVPRDSPGPSAISPLPPFVQGRSAGRVIWPISVAPAGFRD